LVDLKVALYKANEQINKHHDKLHDQSIELARLKEIKLDSKTFTQSVKEINDKIETIRRA